MRHGFQSFGPLALLMTIAATSAAAQDPVPVEPTVIENPRWTVPPQPVFPMSALDSGVDEGRVVLDCAFGRNGLLMGCRVNLEEPEFAGLGDAALNATRKARVASAVVAAAPADARVWFSIRFLSAE